MGTLICYDRRFSEGYRALALGGAELICVPYNTPSFGQPREAGQETSEVLLRETFSRSSMGGPEGNQSD
jgi:predicted amidohydrolase